MFFCAVSFAPLGKSALVCQEAKEYFLCMDYVPGTVADKGARMEIVSLEHLEFYVEEEAQ